MVGMIDAIVVQESSESTDMNVSRIFSTARFLTTLMAVNKEQKKKVRCEGWFSKMTPGE